jgi:ubiquinol oxidase
MLETIARVPYFAYASCLHLIESFGMRDKRELLRTHYAEADNELHHLLIMEELGGNDDFVDRFIAQTIAFFYYWYNVAIYLLSPQAAYNLGELIEEHAFHTYDKFLKEHAKELQQRPVPDIAHEYYSGRDSLMIYMRKHQGERGKTLPRQLNSLYDVFLQIRDDEAAHWRSLKSLVEYDDLELSSNSSVSNACATITSDARELKELPSSA